MIWAETVLRAIPEALTSSAVEADVCSPRYPRLAPSTSRAPGPETSLGETRRLSQVSENVVVEFLGRGGLISDAQAAQISQGRSASGKAQAPAASTEDHRIFAFDDLDKVIAASKAIASFDTDSKLYKKEGGDSYYVLVLKMQPDKSEDFLKACNMIAEYGRKLRSGAASLAYYDEHYRTVVAEQAVQKLGRI